LYPDQNLYLKRTVVRLLYTINSIWDYELASVLYFVLGKTVNMIYDQKSDHMFRYLGDVRTAVVQMESCIRYRQGVLHAAYTALLVSCTVFTIVKIMLTKFRDVDPDPTIPQRLGSNL
jgi:hypothetical protein